MIYSVDFKEMAGKINHFNVSKYLRDLGWNEFNTKRKNVKIFQKIIGESFYQVDLPTERTLSDYKMAMFRVVETIGETINKSVEQVLLELLNPLSDILRIRIIDQDVEFGSIGFEDAINLYENTKKLITAAAMDIINPKLIHLGRPDDKIQKFISNCRFGQTEIGSYVVSIVCPFAKIQNGEFIQLSIFSEEEECSKSLTREVTKKIISSIKTIKESIDEGNLESTILNIQKNGSVISANFLQALNDINIYKPQSKLDITVKWAPTIQKNISDINSVSISNDYHQPIASLVEKIKSSQQDKQSYTGRISKLESNAELNKREQGKVTLVYFIDNNKTATASVNLDKDDYENAIRAHQNGELVRITGILTGLKKKTINDPNFEVIKI